MHGVSLNSGISPLKGSIIIYTINEFKGINIKLRNDSVADNIYVQQNTMSSHLQFWTHGQDISFSNTDRMYL